MTDFDSMFRNLPKTTDKTQVGGLLTTTEPSAVVALRGRLAERTSTATETQAQQMAKTSRAQKSKGAATFDWIPLEPAVSTSGPRAAVCRRVAPVVCKTGALSALFFALQTVTAQIDIKSVFNRFGSDAISLATNAGERRYQSTVHENSEPLVGAAQALTWAPVLSDRTQGFITEALKTEAVRIDVSQPLLDSGSNVEQANAQTTFPASKLTVARYYRQPENSTDDELPAPSVAPRTEAPATPSAEQPVPLIRPIQLQNAQEPILRSEWQIQKSKGNRRLNLDKTGDNESPSERYTVAKPSDATLRALNTGETGRRSIAGKASTENGNTSAVIEPASGLENGRKAPRANERARSDQPALERIEQVTATKKTMQQRGTNGRAQKQRLQGQARAQSVDTDWRSRRSSLGSQGRDQVDAPTHLTVLGMRIPTLKPIWADDVFNKATR